MLVHIYNNNTIYINIYTFQNFIYHVLSICPSVPLSIRPSVPPSLRPSVHPSLRLSVPPSLCPSVPLSLRLSVPPSLSLSVSLFPSTPYLANILFSTRWSLVDMCNSTSNSLTTRAARYWLKYRTLC